MPFSNVQIKPNDSRTFSLDKKGTIRFKLKRDQSYKKKVLSHLGFQAYETLIVPDSDYKINFFLDESSGHKIIDEIWNYDVKTSNDDKIVLQKVNTKKEKWVKKDQKLANQ